MSSLLRLSASGLHAPPPRAHFEDRPMGVVAQGLYPCNVCRAASRREGRRDAALTLHPVENRLVAAIRT